MSEISGVPIQFKGKICKISLERLDSTKNYTKDNTKLIIGELNIAKMGAWSKEKFQYVKDIVMRQYPQHFANAR